jgi:nucleoside-diphosphate-sugar epimerase
MAGVDFIECDLASDESILGALATVYEKYGNQVASVIHLAAYCDFSGAPSPVNRKLTVESTWRLLQGLGAFDLEQFVFSSTLLVKNSAEVEDEAVTKWPGGEKDDETGDYARSKAEAEQAIEQEWQEWQEWRGWLERGNIPAVILRIAGVYDEECHSIPIAQQINHIYEKKLESYLFSGATDHGQAFVHVDDLVDCFLRVIELRRELGSYEVFLIAEPDVMSYAELQDQIGELVHGAEWPTIRIPKLVAKAGAWAQETLLGREIFIKSDGLWAVDLADLRFLVEIGRARNRLGWDPQHRLRDTLSKMVGGLKENPRRWRETNNLTPPDGEKRKNAKA